MADLRAIFAKHPKEDIITWILSHMMFLTDRVEYDLRSITLNREIQDAEFEEKRQRERLRGAEEGYYRALNAGVTVQTGSILDRRIRNIRIAHDKAWKHLEDMYDQHSKLVSEQIAAMR